MSEAGAAPTALPEPTPAAESAAEPAPSAGATPSAAPAPSGTPTPSAADSSAAPTSSAASSATAASADTSSRGAGAPRQPRHRVAPAARAYWLITRGLVLIVALAATLVPAWFWESGRTWLLISAGVLTVLLLPSVLLSPWLRYRVHRWETTGTAVYSRTGWLGRQWRIAPLSRVQTVEAKRNVLHRMLGLAAVMVTTGSAQGAVEIQGIDADVADELVAELTDAVEQTRGDAT